MAVCTVSVFPATSVRENAAESAAQCGATPASVIDAAPGARFVMSSEPFQGMDRVTSPITTVAPSASRAFP